MPISRTVLYEEGNVGSLGVFGVFFGRVGRGGGDARAGGLVVRIPGRRAVGEGGEIYAGEGW